MRYYFCLVAFLLSTSSIASALLDVKPSNKTQFLALIKDKQGDYKVKAGSDVTEYIVTGGFVEVSGTAASVLAEQAMPKSEVTSDVVDALVQDAETFAEGKIGPEKDIADKRVADTKALLELL